MENVLYVLDVTFNICRLLVIPSIFILVFILIKKGLKFYTVALLLPFVSLILIMQSFPYLARVKLNNVMDEEVIYFEVGEPLDKAAVFKSLKNLKYVPSKNSHPVGPKIKITIVTDKSRRDLFIRADVNNESVYWLYDSKYSYSRTNNIGYLKLK
ncbi:hypothetical protein [Photobacterium sp. OFAV2-7]|uniref:hypothetical protein n=1 Tax=Photobacterium sp. OFAV2-7 TaxID=2917748 RepID=UPI001EF5D9E6|nr:hypothetical protein [Photobacterium sp. OFAV2-7]MCG7586816.1 hypothetical protein [Photobacterium sp. OFAV2-7]